MEKLQELCRQIREAQDWCDHNGDFDTGYVSITVDTLQHWEDTLIDAIDEIEATWRTEVAYADTELDV